MNKNNDNTNDNENNEIKYLEKKIQNENTNDEYISEKENDTLSVISSGSSSISSISRSSSSTELENDSKLLSIIETIDSLKKFMDNIHKSQMSIQKECNRIYGNKFE